jgi:hypothetical protein
MRQPIVIVVDVQVVLFALVAAVYAEAEAEADPALLYAGLPYAYGLAAPFKSAPCVNAANVPVPCAAGYAGYAGYGYYGHPYLYGRKKREAEADADALYYAAHPYAYGAYPYAYGAYAPVAYTHLSNLGICTNYLGVQVPC